MLRLLNIFLTAGLVVVCLVSISSATHSSVGQCLSGCRPRGWWSFWAWHSTCLCKVNCIQSHILRNYDPQNPSIIECFYQRCAHYRCLGYFYKSWKCKCQCIADYYSRNRTTTTEQPTTQTTPPATTAFTMETTMTYVTEVTTTEATTTEQPTTQTTPPATTAFTVEITTTSEVNVTEATTTEATTTEMTTTEMTTTEMTTTEMTTTEATTTEGTTTTELQIPTDMIS